MLIKGNLTLVSSIIASVVDVSVARVSGSDKLHPIVPVRNLSYVRGMIILNMN